MIDRELKRLIIIEYLSSYPLYVGVAGQLAGGEDGGEGVGPESFHHPRSRTRELPLPKTRCLGRRRSFVRTFAENPSGTVDTM